MTFEVEQLERIIENEIAELRTEFGNVSYEWFRKHEFKIIGMVKLLSKVTGTHYMFSISKGLRNCGYPETID